MLWTSFQHRCCSRFFFLLQFLLQAASGASLIVIKVWARENFFVCLHCWHCWPQQIAELLLLLMLVLMMITANRLVLMAVDAAAEVASFTIATLLCSFALLFFIVCHPVNCPFNLSVPCVTASAAAAAAYCSLSLIRLLSDGTFWSLSDRSNLLSPIKSVRVKWWLVRLNQQQQPVQPVLGAGANLSPLTELSWLFLKRMIPPPQFTLMITFSSSAKVAADGALQPVCQHFQPATYFQHREDLPSFLTTTAWTLA